MIIGLVGFIGSGKNTVANILAREHGYRQFAFADSLKDAVASIFLWPRGLLEGDSTASRQFREQIDPWWSEKFGYDVTPRLILQKFGTEACRNNLSDNIWIASMEKRMMGYQDVVITDVRFPNEIKFVRSAGGKILRVKRGPDPEWVDWAVSDNFLGTHYMEEEAYMGKRRIHPSEYKWVGETLDGTIHNDFTIQQLKGDVNFVLTSFEKSATIFHHQV